MESKKKKGSEEPRGRTGIKTQTQRMDLRTQGGGNVSLYEVSEWHGLIYTTNCKTQLVGSRCIAQGDQLSAFLPPRGVGKGGWEGDTRGRRYGDICICVADSLCYKAETNKPL